MREEIKAAIAKRAPLAWSIIQARGIFGGPLPSQVLASTVTRPKGIRERFMSLLRQHFFDYFGRK